MPHAILLDLDGTLIDSHPGMLESTRAALRALGHEPDPALDIKQLIGPPLEEAMHVLLKPYNDDRVTEAAVTYRRHYGEIGFLDSVPYPGIADALTAMKRAGLRLYLATSKRETFARRILDHLNFTPHFEAIHGAKPDGALEHKPALLAHIIAHHSLSPTASLMVGDRRHDIEGAKAMNMRSLGALWGYGTSEELQTAGADQLLTTPTELPEAALAMLTSKTKT